MTAPNDAQSAGPRPELILSAATLNRIESLAEGSMQRNPAMANRLLDELGRASIVAPDELPANVVAIGNAVTYRDESTGQERTVTLVFPEDADIDQQRVSVITPLGVALIGLSEGAAFYWDTRADQRRMLTVIRVQPAGVPTDTTGIAASDEASPHTA